MKYEVRNRIIPPAPPLVKGGVGGFILLFASCFLLLTGRASSAATLTLDGAIQRAIANNPALKAAGEDARAARARVPQAVTPDNPEVGITFDRTPINTFNVEDAMSIDYRIKQVVPFPTKLISAGSAAKNEYRAAQNIQRQTALNITAEVKKAYFNVLLIDKKTKIEKYNRDLFRRYTGVAETRYATGKSPFEDPIKASIEAASFETRLSELSQERATLIANLGYLLGEKLAEDIKLITPHPTPSPPPKFRRAGTRGEGLEELEELALKNQPALKAASDLKRAAEGKLSLAKQGYLPDIMAEFEYNQIKNSQNAWTSSFGISLPLWFLGRQQSAIRETRAMKNAAAKIYENVYNELNASIISTYERIKSSRRIMDIYEETILPKAGANVRSAEVSYTTGKADFLNLVDSARMWREYQLDYWQARTDYEIAIAEMEALTGNVIASDQRKRSNPLIPPLPPLLKGG